MASRSARPDLPADLNMEDNEANNLALVDLDEFSPARIYPGASWSLGTLASTLTSWS